MRRWRSQRPSRNTSTSRSQQCGGTVPVPGCITNEIPEGRLGRVQTQAGPAGSGSAADQTGGQCPSGHHDQNFYWQKTRICGRAQITHLEWMTRRSGKKAIRPAKKLTGWLLPRHDIGLVLFAALSAGRAECKDVEVSERMCCNFQESARERQVGSTRLRLLICTQN